VNLIDIYAIGFVLVFFINSAIGIKNKIF